jgi:hypothetical protein
MRKKRTSMPVMGAEKPEHELWIFGFGKKRAT